MVKSIVNTDGNKYVYAEIGAPVPTYTIFAKNQNQAYKKLVDYLERIGKLHKLESMRLVDE